MCGAWGTPVVRVKLPAEEGELLWSLRALLRAAGQALLSWNDSREVKDKEFNQESPPSSH